MSFLSTFFFSPISPVHIFFYPTVLFPDNNDVCCQTFKIWKEKKDEKIKEKTSQQKMKEREKKEREAESKAEREKDSLSAFRGWYVKSMVVLQYLSASAFSGWYVNTSVC